MSTTTSFIQVTDAGNTADFALPVRLVMKKGKVDSSKANEITYHYGVSNAADPTHSMTFKIKRQTSGNRLRVTMSMTIWVVIEESTTGAKKYDTFYGSIFFDSPTNMEVSPTQIRNGVSQLIAQSVSPLATNAWDPTAVAELMSGNIDAW